MTVVILLLWIFLIVFIFSSDAEKIVMLNFILCIYLLYYFLANNIAEHFRSKKSILIQLVRESLDIQLSAFRTLVDNIKCIDKYIIMTVFFCFEEFFRSLSLFFSKLLFKELIIVFYLKFYNQYLNNIINNIFSSFFSFILLKENYLLQRIEKRVYSKLQVLPYTGKQRNVRG